METTTSQAEAKRNDGLSHHCKESPLRGEKIRKIFFSFFPLVALLILTEVGARCWYYQSRTEYPFALVHLYEHLLRLKAKHEYLAMRPQDPQKHYADFYNAPEMGATRNTYFTQYEAVFKDFVNLCKESDTILLALYIPSQEVSRATSRAYFRKLFEKYHIPYLDVSETLSNYPTSVTCLLPKNAHLSRFGNQLIADKLALFLQPFLDHRSQIQYSHRPTLLGDLRPNDDSIWRIEPELPYRVITNSQGLRRKGNVSFPKSRLKSRILFVGDSFIFGAYMNNHDCVPQLLEEKIQNIEAINAGVAGYTLCDEFSYFEEKGRYLAPDIVVLQLLDNDLYGFFPYMQKQFCRGGKYCVRKHPHRGFLNF